MEEEDPIKKMRFYKKDSPDTPETLAKEEACISSGLCSSLCYGAVAGFSDAAFNIFGETSTSILHRG